MANANESSGTKLTSFVKLSSDFGDGSLCMDSTHMNVMKNQSEDDLFFPFGKLHTRRRVSLESAEKHSQMINSVRQLRATMPDHTRRVLNAVTEDKLSSLSTSSFPSTTSSGTTVYTPTTDSSQVDQKYSRSYSRAQVDIEADLQNQSSSSDSEAFAQRFQKSVGGFNPAVQTTGFHRVSSSPDFRSLSTNSERQSYLPEHSILAKMVGARKQNTSSNPDSLSLSSSSLSTLPSSSSSAGPLEKKGLSSSAQIHNDQTNKKVSDLQPCQPKSDIGSGGKALDNVDSGPSGFGLLSRTRNFGAWLSTAVEGEKVDISKKDLNVFAPTTF